MRLLNLTILLFLTVSAQAKWHKEVFTVMGTKAQVEFWEPNEVKGRRLIKEVIAEMNRIDQLMSPYIKTSELYQVNQKAGEGWVGISKELFLLLEQSNHYSRITNGAFDITYASVGYQYNYRDEKAPSDAFIEQQKSLINYQSIELNKQKLSVRFKKPGIKIDLGGIAKGHAVDTSIEILKNNGITHAFVKAGGDSRLLGDKRGRLWTIGIRHPRKDGEVLTQVPLENVAISTSGDYERFFIRDGERIHHILDPKTGRSSNNSISVSIIANDSTTADALSTSVFVMGPVEGLELINQLEDISAIIIDKKGKFHYSKDLSAQ